MGYLRTKKTYTFSKVEQIFPLVFSHRNIHKFYINDIHEHLQQQTHPKSLYSTGKTDLQGTSTGT
jgi:hypothetical protein